GIRCPDWGIASSGTEAAMIAHRIGYPVLVRPSYVLGGRAMRVCYRGAQVVQAFHAIQGRTLVDRFLENAVEIDVDALSDGEQTYVAAVMQHVEEAGVHSGDSACVLPAPSLTAEASLEINDIVRRLGPALGVIGLLNVQLAVADGDVFVLEVNPRASRTVPFASKATGITLVAAARRRARGPRVQARRDLGHGRHARCRRARGGADREARRGRGDDGDRPRSQGSLRPGRQHPGRRIGAAQRRLPDPRGGARRTYSLHYDDLGRCRRGARDRERAHRDGALAARADRGRTERCQDANCSALRLPNRLGPTRSCGSSGAGST